MDFTTKDDSLDFEESLYQDLSPQGPTRARRRQSDAKWRASVATCYDTLKHVVPKGHRASKRKVSKAVILQESERHITHLENVLSRMIGTESQASGKAVLWKGDSQLERCTLKHFQEDFAERQYKIFHSSNQGRRCYNLLDEIKEEIFSMTVDPNSLSIVDSNSVPITRCVEKVNGKEVSRFSQLPNGRIIKGKDKTSAVTVNALGKHKMQEKSSSTESFISSELLAHYLEREDQIVPSICSSFSTPSDRNTLDIPSQMYDTTSISKGPSFEDKAGSSGAYTVCVADNTQSSNAMRLDDDNGNDGGDQEVPSFENFCAVSSNETSELVPGFFLARISPSTEGSNGSNLSTSNATCQQSNETSNHPPNHTETQLIKDEDTKTPASTISIETFMSKCLNSSSLLKSLTERGKDSANKPKTARKLNFNRPECMSALQTVSDTNQPRCRHMSPMLAGFTPIKLSPNVSYCITCKQPDESLVSPWKPFQSPLYQANKEPQEKSPMIDPDNSLFCFEALDVSTEENKDEADEEKTPALHCLSESNNPSNQAFKRKTTHKNIDLLGKCQPKCRKNLEGFFDVGVCKSVSSSHSKPFTISSNETHLVPSCNLAIASHGQEREVESNTTKTDGNNDDTIDFDGFFFYFRQIGQQLKDQQKLSCKEIQSPSVAAKVMKMWMRLPSPDKQTIKTLALLDSQEACPSQEGLGGLSQDLQDVDVEPIDLKEFIPTTPV